MEGVGKEIELNMADLMVEKRCIPEGEYSASRRGYWWSTYYQVCDSCKRWKLCADYSGLLDPKSVTGLVVLHAERYSDTQDHYGRSQGLCVY